MSRVENKFAGVVVLYNPDIKVITNIQSYIQQLDILYVLDNSKNTNKNIVDSLVKYSKVKYVKFTHNIGIAAALNYALREATEYEFLLTMDQDSKFEKDMFKKYQSYIESRKGNDSIGIFSANNMMQSYETQYSFAESVMTSGNLVNVKVASLLNGFNEELFIDEVDHEFCYRIRLAGYKILCFYDVIMEHHLGDMQEKSFFNLQFHITNHNPLRQYYMVRNRLYVMDKYPQVRKKYMGDLLKIILKIILYENKKIEKLKFIAKGFFDYRDKNFGKYMDK